MNASCLAMFFIATASCCLVYASEDHAHDHGEVEAIQITDWNGDVEVFMEYEPFVAEKATEIITHITLIKNWQPRKAGPLTLVFSVDGETPFEVHAEAPLRDGIYLPKVTFPHRGTWQLDVRIPLDEGESQLTFHGLEVYSSDHGAEHGHSHDDVHDHEQDAAIAFLKEQQWRMPFRSMPVIQATFQESQPAFGTIRTRAGGEIQLEAMVSGRFLAPANQFVLPGASVKRGQKLGTIIPQLQVGEDPSTLHLAVKQAELALDFALKERARMARLFEQEAIPQNRLHLAELEVETSKADLTAAKNRLQQVRASQRASQKAGKERIDVYAPISGTLLKTQAVPGAAVKQGEPLFIIADLSRVWLETHIPQAHVARVQQARSAWFQVEGMNQVFRITEETGGKFIALGGELHPQKRTLPLIFELENPDGLLRSGMFAEVSVLTGPTVSGLSVPFQALVEESGQPVVYVQTGGESFERRVVQVGIRDGNSLQILKGLTAGERVVTQGVYQVRLAAASDAVPSHGHTH